MKRSALFALFLPLFASAQNDPYNLDFERFHTPVNGFTPWYATYYYKKGYTVSADSIEMHKGRYSVRVQYTPDNPQSSDAQFYNQVPLDVVCKELKVSFYVKTAGDTAGGGVGIVAYQDKLLRTSKVALLPIPATPEWTRYTVAVTMDSVPFPIYQLQLTTGYRGKGNMWLDDITIEADGKNVYDLPSFSSTPGEKAAPLTARQTDYTMLLGQLWGFFKYFHPQVAAGTFNWDLELIKMLPVVKKAADNEAFSHVLLQWIESLGKVPPCYPCALALKDSVITSMADLRWMKHPAFTTTLQQKLQHIYDNRHLGSSYYVKTQEGSNPEFTAEHPYAWRQMAYPNEAFRLLAGFRYWNIIHYFYPYKDIIGRDWNEVLKEYVQQAAAAQDSLAYNKVLLKLIVSVNDNHASSFNAVVNKEFPYQLPVSTTYIENKIVVTGISNDSLAAPDDWQKGDVIEKTDGHSIQQAIDDWGPFVGGSNTGGKMRKLNGGAYLTGGKDSLTTVVINRNGHTISKQVHRYTLAQLKPQYSYKTAPWTILPGNIGYVHMGALQKKQVDSMMAALKDTRSIIFDIRAYPQGTMWLLIEYLHEKPVHFATITSPNLRYPGTFRKAPTDFLGGPSSARRTNVFHYKGKIVMLVNQETQSQAEWTTMAFQTVPGSYTIGSQTAGADGNASNIYLPGNLFTYMTGLGVFYPDGTPTQRIGIKINKVVEPTIKGIAAGKDEVLEAALQYIGQ